MKIDPFPGELTTQLVEHPFVTKTGRHGCQRNYTIVLTPEQAEWLRRYYPEVEGPVLMQLSGMSHSTLHRFAREMHLVKSAKGLRAIKRRQARHIKKVCERNGYYDSLRGRQPSEACRKATEYCDQQGYPIDKLAIQYSTALNPRIATTLFSSANPKNVLKNIGYVNEPFDAQLAQKVQEIIGDQMRVRWKNT